MKPNEVTPRLLMGAFTVLLALVIGTAGCASTTSISLDPTDISPASMGTLELRTDDNNNFVMRVIAEFLPLPEALDDDFTTYVVWIRPVGTQTYINLGQLRIDEDRSGQLDATTPFGHFDMFITAEPSPSVLSPGEAVLLQARVGESSNRVKDDDEEAFVDDEDDEDEDDENED